VDGVCLSRRELARGAVRPGCVVVQEVCGQHLAQVVMAGDQQSAGKLAAQGGGDCLADGPQWSGDALMTSGDPL
jgi:hypothetical protein